MLVRVYPDGEEDKARTYQVEPHEATRTWMIECADSLPHDMVAEPLDDEARALPGWTVDVDGTFRLFKVVPVVIWNVYDVTPPPDRTGPKLKGSAR